MVLFWNLNKYLGAPTSKDGPLERGVSQHLIAIDWEKEFQMAAKQYGQFRWRWEHTRRYVGTQVQNMTVAIFSSGIEASEISLNCSLCSRSSRKQPLHLMYEGASFFLIEFSAANLRSFLDNGNADCRHQF